MGSTLFERLEDAMFLTELECARIAQQMFSAVLHMHRREICHRDLKLENWRLMGDESAPCVKLVNFAVSEFCREAVLTRPCGTLHYLAPEVLRARYGKAADVWTLGVVIFLSLYAAYPFDGDSCLAVMQGILSSEPKWSECCNSLSPEAGELLRRLLSKDPHRRICAKEALAHEWFSIAAGQSCRVASSRVATAESMKALCTSRGMGPLRSVSVDAEMIAMGTAALLNSPTDADRNVESATASGEFHSLLPCMPDLQ